MRQRSIDSGPWPGDFARAQSVKPHVPSEPPPVNGHPPTGVKTVEAELEIAEIQNLGENVHAVKAAAIAANCTIKFRVVVELSSKDALSDNAVDKVNKALAEVSSKLQLR